jgi:hypothetical protein
MMRVRLVAPFAVLMSTACAATPKDRLQGKWVGERVDNFNTTHEARAQGWVTGASFEFRGSRVTVSLPAEGPRQGTFHVARASEHELVVAFLRPQGASDEVTFQIEGDDRMRWMLGDGRSILLRRVSD